MQLTTKNNVRFTISEDDYERVSKLEWVARKTKYGYIIISSHGPDGQRNLARFITLPGPGLCVDHIDHNTLNNYRSNLRICTHAQNNINRNKSSQTKNNFKGVTYRKSDRIFMARIKVNNIAHNLGHYKDPIKAAQVYDYYAYTTWKEFAQLNFPEQLSWYRNLAQHYKNQRPLEFAKEFSAQRGRPKK